MLKIGRSYKFKSANEASNPKGKHNIKQHLSSARLATYFSLKKPIESAKSRCWYAKFSVGNKNDSVLLVCALGTDVPRGLARGAHARISSENTLKLAADIIDPIQSWKALLTVKNYKLLL